MTLAWTCLQHLVPNLAVVEAEGNVVALDRGNGSVEAAAEGSLADGLANNVRPCTRPNHTSKSQCVSCLWGEPT